MSLALLLPLVAWIVLWNLLGRYTFGHGPLIAACLTGVGLLCAIAGPLARRLAGWPPRVPARAVVGGLVLATTVFVGLHARALDRALGSDRMVDIGRNTLCAGEALFDHGRNPYAVRCQMLSVRGAPHVTYVRGQPHMFGVPYRHGYPYFPAMFLAFEPFRQLGGGLDSLRWANGCWLLLALGGSAWLAARLRPGPRAPLAAALAATALVSIPVLGFELFQVGVTDLIIGVFALGGFLALTGGRLLLGGVLLGLACAAKLMPGGLLLPILAVWSWRSPPGGRWRFWAGLVGAMLIVWLPFVAADPPSFLSATVLYYLSRHAPGDDTSLWYHLPAALQAPFLIAGAAAVVGVLIAGLRRRALAVGDLLAVWVLAYLTFCVFNKMIHLNYLWSILPCAGVVLAVRLAAASDAPSSSSSHQAGAPRPDALQPPPGSGRQ